MTTNRAARRAARFNRCTIALSIEGDSLPAEFRLFIKGWNDSEKGKFLFDDKAAKAVMAAYEAWGIDVPIDLEHQMLDVPGGAPDPTARDARGWCRLELRNGELWATDVRWTPDGAARLAEKRQRYVSPAFEADAKSGRVTKIINVAITALPATHNTPALVAASATGENNVKKKHVQAAIDAIEKGDHQGALACMKAMLTEAATDGDADGAEGDGADGVADPSKKPEKQSAEEEVDPKVVKETDADGDNDGDEKNKTERKAMHVLLRTLTGAKSFAEAVATVDTYRASHMTLETERQKLAKERNVLESAERRALCVELVKLGAEFPSTVWADDAQSAVKPRWAKMPLAELRAHVGDHKAARSNKAGGVKPAVVGGESAVTGLSASELKICEELKCEPAVYARLKARRDENEKAGS